MIRFTVAVPGTSSSYSVDIGCYQWGYVEGIVYITRELGVTPFGARFREVPVGVQARALEVRFARNKALIDQLRTLGIFALRYGVPVKFIPDTTDPGTFRWIDWSETVETTHILENRRETTLKLVEQPYIMVAVP